MHSPDVARFVKLDIDRALEDQATRVEKWVDLVPFPFARDRISILVPIRSEQLSRQLLKLARAKARAKVAERS